jgi:CRP-like cAMP-binding protein
VIVANYRDFSTRVQYLTAGELTKPDRIRETIKGTIGKITKIEIMSKCPDISRITVQRTLSDLLKRGEIIKLGGGRYTEYIWNRERMT